MGGAAVSDELLQSARTLGGLIAARGWILLNGGRNQGVMAASAAGARAAGGVVIGILPDRDDRHASPDLDVAVCTGLGDARNVINVLTSDVVIACPGGLGTWSEIVLALKNQKRVILLQRPTDPELATYFRNGQLTEAETPAQAVEQAAAFLTKRFGPP